MGSRAALSLNLSTKPGAKPQFCKAYIAEPSRTRRLSLLLYLPSTGFKACEQQIIEAGRRSAEFQSSPCHTTSRTVLLTFVLTWPASVPTGLAYIIGRELGQLGPRGLPHDPLLYPALRRLWSLGPAQSSRVFLVQRPPGPSQLTPSLPTGCPPAPELHPPIPKLDATVPASM